MDLDKALESRRSIREYSDKKVTWGIFSDILSGATHSASSGNVQNSRFIIVTKDEKKRQLAIASLKQMWMQTAHAIIVICADYSNIKRLYEERYKELSLQNCTIAANNIMLKAASHGLGTCYIGIFDKEAVSKLLKLPEHFEPMIMLTLGYPDEKPVKIGRIPLANTLFYEEFGKKKRS